MQNKIDYFFQKATDWIFRKKSILYLLVLALFREFTAINISDTLSKWEVDPNLQEWYFHYPIMFFNFIFSGGNWNVVWILVTLIVIFIIYELIKTYIESKKEIIMAETKNNQIVINKSKVKKQVNIKKIENLEKLEL